MKIRKHNHTEDKAELQMTSMIDVVFLLLIFFVMTFKISVQEGDFNVRMPQPGTAAAPQEQTSLPLNLRLRADGNGRIAEIILNDNSFGQDFNALNQYILSYVGGTDGPQGEDSPEVEIDLDYNLRYEHVIQAITAVTGQRQGDDIIRLVEKIKFAPTRKGE
ncbi:MAG: biopolymer transporter ExbD [Planctomycetaceae bacterium]|nr:biopolymer transporter ExbD [Planctomycetaceae bacterium]MBN8602340.1 biopolymer transporter ExbD [Planctomycetota bacterium]